MDRGAQDEVRLALPVLDLKSLFLSDNKRFFYFRGRKYKTTILYITIVSQVAVACATLLVALGQGGSWRAAILRKLRLALPI